MARLHSTSVATLQDSQQPFITCLSRYPSEDLRRQLGMFPKAQSMGWLVIGLHRAPFMSENGQTWRWLALLKYH